MMALGTRLMMILSGAVVMLLLHSHFAHMPRRNANIRIPQRVDLAQNADAERPSSVRRQYQEVEIDNQMHETVTTVAMTTKAVAKKPVEFASIGACLQDVKPRRHVVYIKVQKTASTTVRVIFQMFALKNNLQICMDSIDFFHLGWPSPFVNELVLKPHGKRCELLAEEMVYTRKEIEKIVHSDSIYLASVTNPIKHFMSMFNFNLIADVISKAIGRTFSQHEAARIYLDDPVLIRNLFNTLNETEKSSGHQLVAQMRNLQLHDFGVVRSEELDKAELQDKINGLISEFHFIILADRFDESMVLLRKVLCWSFDDLMYVRLNSAQSSKQRKKQIPDDLQQLISTYHEGDMMLYKSVNIAFQKKLAQHKDFSTDLEIYKQKLKEHAKLCSAIDKEENRPKQCFPISIETFWAELQVQLKIDNNKRLLEQGMKL